MTKYIVCYILKVGNLTQTFWVRDEYAGNYKNNATRFNSLSEASARIEKMTIIPTSAFRFLEVAD